jgi:hypothetical protein
MPVASHLVKSNQESAVDVACDTLATGWGIRVLAGVDAFSRENLFLEVVTSLSSHRVTRASEVIIERRGRPEWGEEHNGERPRSSLGYRTPNEFAAILKSSARNG